MSLSLHWPWWVTLALIVLLYVLVRIWVRSRRVGRTTLVTRSEKRSESSRPGRKVIYYRTKDGQADYGFSFDRRSEGYRIYIIQQPSYEGRADDSHSAHRLRDDKGPYVCWTGKLETESQAQHVAARWADCTQNYIRFGIPFG